MKCVQGVGITKPLIYANDYFASVANDIFQTQVDTRELVALKQISLILIDVNK